MAITENIVRMMNGTIDVKSEEGVGSTFTVSIPMDICQEKEALSGSYQETDAETAGEDKKKTGFLGRKVLLAEDNDINREIVEELLQMHHMIVDSTENGQLVKEAFEASAPGDYCAILMDIQMPVMNGYDAAAAIRKLPREDARTIPIIALTANAFTSDAMKARNAGMNDHLAKPVEVERLLEVLQKWIGQPV